MSQWPLVKFNDLVDLERGYNPPKSDFIYEPKEGYVRFYQIRDGKNDNNIVYVPDTAKLHKVTESDILMVAYRHIGGVYRGVSGAYNVALCKITNKDRENLDDDYLYYLISSSHIKGELLKHSERSLIPSMSVSHLASLLVPLPSLKEQKRIVAILDEAFVGISQAIANTEKNLANARELFESYLNDTFNKQISTWTLKTLKEIAKDFGRGKSKHRPRNDSALFGGQYPFIQTGDVRNTDHIISNYSQTYNEIGLKQSKLWPEGTICITIAANIAETGILSFAACFPDSIIGLVVDDCQATNEFVEYLLQAMKLRIKAKSQGSAQNNINLATFEQEYFPFPDLKEQQKIVNKLDSLAEQIRNLEITYQQKLQSLAELKQSLLQKAFSGELTANNVDKLVNP